MESMEPMATRSAVLRYAREALDTEPDCPFSGDTQTLVLRHADSGKWFALLMCVRADRLTLKRGGEVEIMNVKVDPLLTGSLRTQRGILPAYHMNKERWISVLLDGSVPLEQALALLDMSYALTQRGGAR